MLTINREADFNKYFTLDLFHIQWWKFKNLLWSDESAQEKTIHLDFKLLEIKTDSQQIKAQKF